ncbi:MAG TPA: sister chromatid cohesion protein PDS5 [Pirellulales bacterium]|jgi:HEAT repeat protein
MANTTSAKAAFALSIAAFCVALLVLGAGALWLYTLPENAGGGEGGFVIIGQLLLLELIFCVLTFVSFLSAAFAAIVLRKARWLLFAIAPFAALAIWLSFFIKAQRTVDLYGPSDVPALIQSLSSDKKRETSITVLAHLGNAAARAVGDALHHGDKNIRLGSAQTLRDMCDRARAAIPQLVEATHDIDWEVRAMVAEALGHIRPNAEEVETVVPAICELLRDKDSRVRFHAAVALSWLAMENYVAAEAAVPDLASALRDEDGYVRQYAAQTLATIGEAAKPAVPALFAVQETEGLYAQIYAASALWKASGDTEIPIARLRKLSVHNDEYVRREAIKVLGEILAKEEK